MVRSMGVGEQKTLRPDEGPPLFDARSSSSRAKPVGTDQRQRQPLSNACLFEIASTGLQLIYLRSATYFAVHPFHRILIAILEHIAMDY